MPHWSLQCRGVLLVILLVGNEVATIARRIEVNNVLDALSPDEDADIAVEVAETFAYTSSACKMKGTYGSGKCQPDKYCYYGRRWSNLGGLLRDKSCHLKWLYKSDEKLATRFGSISSQVVKDSEAFRRSGSIFKFLKLKDHYAQFGKCANAATSEKPTHKTLLNRLKTSFQTEQIGEFAALVNSFRDQLPNMKKFKSDGLSDEVLQANTLMRVEENVDIGSKKSKILGPLASKINFAELMKLKDFAGQDKATIAAQVQRVMPSLTPEQAAKVSSDAVDQTSAGLETCNNDEECMKAKSEQALEDMNERVSELEETHMDALLEYAESSGLSKATVNETRTEKRVRAASLLEEHVESVNEEDLTEHGKALRAKGNAAAFPLFFCVIFIIIAVFCAAAPGCAIVFGIFAGLCFLATAGAMKEEIEKEMRSPYDTYYY